MRYYQIIILFFTVLISYINSGLCKVYDIQSSKVLREEPFPCIQHFSIIDYFLYTNIDVGTKNKFNPDKIDKFLQKTKFWYNNANNELIHKYPDGNYNHLLTNPIFIIKIFSSPDICFPFNYFW